MAGPFTHMLICEAASDPTIAAKFSVNLPSALRQILAANHCYLLLGASSPDLPAISDVLGGSNWSDRMHNGNLNRVPVQIFSELKAAGCRDARLAWLFGYVGHIIADVVVHPVVRLAIARRGGANVHRRCEITQDCLLFKDIKTFDLTVADFFGSLKECRSDENKKVFGDAMALWAKCLNACGASFHGDCADWYTSYVTTIEFATELPRLIFYNTIYPSVDEISQDDRRDFYDDVILPVPANEHGTFRGIVFELAVKRLVAVWKQMWDCLVATDPSGIGPLIQDWDLNSGQNRTTQTNFDLWVTP
jgi:hypothetical protein